MVVFLYYRIIVQFAGERIFKIGTHLAKLQAKWLIALHALFEVHCPAKSSRFRQLTCINHFACNFAKCIPIYGPNRLGRIWPNGLVHPAVSPNRFITRMVMQACLSVVIVIVVVL